MRVGRACACSLMMAEALPDGNSSEADRVRYIIMACVVVAYVVMACVVMAYIVMAYIVMAEALPDGNSSEADRVRYGSLQMHEASQQSTT